jgi:UDP-N-acetylglucosamine--N-acetylmuramyl-(pentapeptide) pyrophosphoryl-undecaprenol N-acetylglucosamine transferase
VGMGGYVAGPAGAAAWLWRKPLIIHEQNAVAGTTNRMLAPMASRVLAAFPGAFPADVDCRVVGNPVRQELVEAGAAGHYEFTGQRPLRLLVLGGSLGARPINRVVPGAVAGLLDSDDMPRVEVWHQSGESHLDEVSSAYGQSLGHGVKVAPFIEDMAAAYAWADLVLCRAGALTVSELAVMGRPSVLVPLPHAIDDHQSANARSLTGRGAALLLRQDDMTAESLQQILEELLAEPRRLAAMAAAASEAATPDAARQVCDCCEELIHGR